MSSGTYKPTQTHHSTIQAIRLWQVRLRTIIEALQTGKLDRARLALADLRGSVKPDAFPEFAENLLWLYRSVDAHLDAGKVGEAILIVESLRRLLEAAIDKLHNERSSRPPFTPPKS